MAAISQPELRTDWAIFLTTVATIALACVPVFAFHDSAAATIIRVFDVITQNLGVLYLWYGTGAVAFLVWLAASRFGRVKLGSSGERPEFSTFSWLAMIFCAGVGATLLYWAVIEWGHYISRPPFGLSPRSPEAIE